MINDNFVKVFDVLDSGFKDWTFSAFGLIFVVVGIIVLVSPRIIHAMGIPNLAFKSKFQTFFRYGFLGFAILWTAVTFLATYSEHVGPYCGVTDQRVNDATFAASAARRCATSSS